MAKEKAKETKMKYEIEIDVPIPDEYEPVRIGIARNGDDTVNGKGEVINWIGSSTWPCLIVKEKYRDVDKCDIGHVVEVSDSGEIWVKARLLGFDSDCISPYITRGASAAPGTHALSMWRHARIKSNE